MTVSDIDAVAAAQKRAVRAAVDYRTANPDFRYRMSADCAALLRRTLRRRELSAAEAAALLGNKA